MNPEQTLPKPKVVLLRPAPVALARLDGRVAVRSLARLLLDPAERWRLDAPVGSAPRLLPAPGASAHHVSLSHTRNAAAAAIGAHPVGVDVESVHRRVNWTRIARAYFSPVEQAWLEQQTEGERKTAFLMLWTCKEAWLKAQGLGLSRLDTARFEPLENHRWIVPGAGWRAETRLLDDGLMISVLWQGAGQPLWLQSRSTDSGGDLLPGPDYRLRWRGESQY